MPAPFINNIGAYIKTIIDVLNPTETAETDGTAIATVGPGFGYNSCQLAVDVGTVAGSPSSFSVVAQIQDSPDGSTSWAAIPGEATLTLNAASTQGFINVGLRANRGYIRAQVVPTFVGGTSPSLQAVAAIVLGGAVELPAI